jgi:hypothetical protein
MEARANLARIIPTTHAGCAALSQCIEQTVDDGWQVSLLDNLAKGLNANLTN